MNDEADQKFANVSVSNVSMCLLIMKTPESLQNGLCFRFLESLFILVSHNAVRSQATQDFLWINHCLSNLIKLLFAIWDEN